MAKKISYLDNLKKEIGQTAKNVNNGIDKYLNGNRALPKGVKIGPSNIKKEAGQLAGALLQGRRYDDKTAKQVKVGKQVGVLKPMPAKKTAAKKK